MLIPDEGYYFGIGAFETIAVEAGTPVFLEQHYERLNRALKFFELDIPMREIERKAEQCLKESGMCEGRKVLKITVSPRNLLVASRENTYREEDYERGFCVDFSRVRRNETSPFTYHKTLNYGDCLLEKRRAKAAGIDEPVFLNMKGIISEGASTNVFFVKAGQVITPEEVRECEEMFLTNSLLGVMPVTSFGQYQFPSQKKGRELLRKYREECF